MRTLRLVPLTLAASLVSMAPQTAAAQDILYWTDAAGSGANVIPGIATYLPGATLTAATSQSDFNSKLASGTYSLAIFGEQGGSVFGGSEGALSTFLAGGGRVIGATWQSSPMAAFFEATMTSQNQSSIGGSGDLFAGIMGNVSLTNPSWGVYAQGYATSGSATCLASFGDGSCAAVLGNGGRTLLLGPLFDTYQDADVGSRFVANGAGIVLGGVNPTVTPEPGTVVLLATGLLAIGGVTARRRRVAR